MAKRARGYPLPSDLEYTEDICPIALCIPNTAWARQVLYSSLRYLATWVAYQRDANHLGKDAADSWKFALESMGGEDNIVCLDDLISDVNAIKNFLLTKKDCCDDGITYGPSDTVETDIDPFTGDPPATYAGESVSSWQEYERFVCHNANLWVDSLIEQAESISNALAIGAVGIGLVAAVIGIIGFVATGGVVSFLVASAAAAALSAGGASSMFDQAAEDFEDSRQVIVCAITQGGNLADAVESAITISGAWDFFFQFVDYDTALAIMLEGDNDGTNLVGEQSSDCDCLCEYVVAYLVDEVEVVSASSTQATVIFKEQENGLGYGGTIWFNRKFPGGYCGPRPTITGVTVDSGPSNMTRIIVEDEGGTDDYYGGFSCNQNPSLLVGYEPLSVYLEQRKSSLGGCATAPFQVTITYTQP